MVSGGGVWCGANQEERWGQPGSVAEPIRSGVGQGWDLVCGQSGATEEEGRGVLPIRCDFIGGRILSQSAASGLWGIRCLEPTRRGRIRRGGAQP